MSSCPLHPAECFKYEPFGEFSYPIAWDPYESCQAGSGYEFYRCVILTQIPHHLGERWYQLQPGMVVETTPSSGLRL